MIRNLNFLRNLPGFGARLYEALNDLDLEVTNLAQQTNSNRKSQPLAPPKIGGLSVIASEGHFSISIQDNSDIYRGISYFLEHSDSPHFINPHVIDLGASRNHSIFLGNSTRFWRAYSSYAGSPPSAPVYFGAPTAPTPVTGGGAIPGPVFNTSQGSGTGSAGQGLQGNGVAPYRSANGLPPSRG